MIEIRREKAEDFDEVYRIISEAFGQEDEAKLVEKLRSNKSLISFVAEMEGRLCGQICFSALTLDEKQTNFLGLAPMAVLPQFQNRGIGSSLIKEGLKEIADEGCEAVFVLGHASYYPRFGFKTAKIFGFTCEFPSPDESFMALELKHGALAGKSGLIRFCPEFSES